MMQTQALAKLLLIFISMLVAFVLALLLGSVDIPLAALLDPQDLQGVILTDIRLPRALSAALIGACLACAGMCMQTLFRNPLADPGLIGVSSGAAVVAAITLGLAPLLSWFDDGQIPELFLFAATFTGGMLASVLVLRISKGEWGTSVSTMLLAGIGINAIALASIGLIKSLSDEQGLRSLVFWMLGSLNGAAWSQFKLLLLFSLLSLPGMLLMAKRLNLLILGEADARFLGLDVERTKLLVLLFSSVAIAAAVASAGIIAFVGLLVPHFARQLLGSNHAYLLPASAMLGATLMLLSDVAARLLFTPMEIPIGVVTALIGGPFFLSIIIKNRNKGFVSV